MTELILFVALMLVFSIAHGWTQEIGQLRKCYSSNDKLIKGKKQVIYYRYKNKWFWAGWNYYYVYFSETSIHLVPPVLFAHFMPRLKLERNTDS